MFRVLFEDDRFRPDMLKIYPTLVISGTGLEELYKKGRYVPLTNETASEIVADALVMAPRWVRVMRVQRDIPAPQILAGPKHGNLRELALALLSERGLSTSEIRSREIGLSASSDLVEDIEMKRTCYSASSGEEIFLEFVGSKTDRVLAYLRLRLPSSRAHRPELASVDCAVVRELKVLGRATPLGQVWSESKQHRGYGASLMAEAERIAEEEWNLRKLFVISALGTKEYYYMLGYGDEGPYVSKVL
jgi:elongator complex protein 3